MNISLKGYHEMVTTLKAGTAVTPGSPVSMEENYTVGDSKSGDLFIGVALHSEGDCAAVQTHGFVTVGYDDANSGTPTLGVCPVAAAGSGKIKKLAAGRNVIVLSLDTTEKTADILL